MAQFASKARRRSGEVVQGVLDVADRSAALIQIERLGLFPVMVDASKAGVAKAVATEQKESGASKPLFSGTFGGFRRRRKPKLQELATYTQQLGNLLKCGMPLTVALGSMTHLESKGIPSDVSKALKQDVMEGKSLSDAMVKQPQVFTDLYINMVKAGEQSGALVEVLKRLSDHYERFAEVQSKFTSALIYPAIVSCVGVVIVIFFMTFMLPKFMTIFQGLKVPLPFATRVLMNISNFFGSVWNWIFMLLIGAVIVVLFVRFKSSPEGKKKMDRLKMKAPIIGKAVRLNLFGQFARTLSTLLVNGVPVLTALKITEDIMPNVVVKQAIAVTREEVTDGKTIAQPLAKSKLFPQLMIDLLKIGEETGDVPGALENIADTYENELSLQLRVMTNLIEPAMIIVMAIGVGGLLFSVLSAMFAITSTLSK
ncbi:MAG TPA: type II secretion system F family protein [Candidatus Saccharimonadales bacterium]|nr:type II secretion system F family protein [Candidatus Saccharimonadales bacterium]